MTTINIKIFSTQNPVALPLERASIILDRIFNDLEDKRSMFYAVVSACAEECADKARICANYRGFPRVSIRGERGRGIRIMEKSEAWATLAREMRRMASWANRHSEIEDLTEADAFALDLLDACAYGALAGIDSAWDARNSIEFLKSAGI